MKIHLAGKVALVTGASRGIGAAIARRMSETGATILCAARSTEAVGDVARSITEAGGLAIPVELDITSPNVRDRVKELLEAHQHIDILVNNAGVTDDDLFMRMKASAWESVMRTNLDPLFHVSQEIVKKMVRARWGRIINVSSVVGLSGNPGQTNYAASKAAMIGFTKSLALEVGSRNITVNAIAPGFIQTSMTESLDEAVKKALETRIALKRLGTADDVAYGAVYLASEEAAYVTGTVLNISGGLYT
ncbi:MAG: 3-oxoacyl-[acyl-carrier-protein] reductase [Acidobacteriota bacterium]